MPKSNNKTSNAKLIYDISDHKLYYRISCMDMIKYRHMLILILSTVSIVYNPLAFGIIPFVISLYALKATNVYASVKVDTLLKVKDMDNSDLLLEIAKFNNKTDKLNQTLIRKGVSRYLTYSSIALVVSYCFIIISTLYV